jgi:16S rRNA (adenine1518-N6/adenine1519-N6)-dimethyltransferase
MTPEGHPGRAKKRFGQHFLEPAWAARLIDRIDPRPDQTFLEIGPGRGALTRPLAPKVRHLIAVEIDRDLAAALAPTLPPHVTVLQRDALATDFAELLAAETAPVRVVGNLPYNVASPILFMLLRAAGDGRVFSDATLMLQKEVADRVVATPGSRDYGAMGIQVALFADATQTMTLPPGAFRPPPKVTSAVVHLRFREPREPVGDLGAFERVVRGLFQQRRKTVGKALVPVAATFGRAPAQVLEQSGVDAGKRPEQLTLAEFAALSRAVL